jgi:hypothetical protein
VSLKNSDMAAHRQSPQVHSWHLCARLPLGISGNFPQEHRLLRTAGNPIDILRNKDERG